MSIFRLKTGNPRGPGVLVLAGVLVVTASPACTPVGQRSGGGDSGPPAPDVPLTATPDPGAARERLFQFRPNTSPLEIGMVVPDIELRDHKDQGLHLSELRGVTVVLTFFETRSPEPSLCPELIARLSELGEMLSLERRGRIHLLAISVDPTHDTGTVMSTYAAARGIRTEGWTLASSDPDAVTDFAARLGVVLWERADGTVGHTLNTVVIDRRGRFVDQFPGTSGWSTSDLLAAATAAADR